MENVIYTTIRRYLPKPQKWLIVLRGLRVDRTFKLRILKRKCIKKFTNMFISSLCLRKYTCIWACVFQKNRVMALKQENLTQNKCGFWPFSKGTPLWYVRYNNLRWFWRSHFEFNETFWAMMLYFYWSNIIRKVEYAFFKSLASHYKASIIERFH